MVTVLPHELPHVGSAQQLPATQALPVPQLALHALSPQVLVNVTPHCVPHVGSAQQVSAAASQALPLPHEVVEQVREPHELVSVTSHCPLHTGRSQHTPETAPAAFLQVCEPHVLQVMVPPQPSSNVPH